MNDEINDFKDDGSITDEDKLWGALSLAIGLIGIIALLMEDKKSRPFIKHAAVHGVAIAVIQVILSIIPGLNCITGFVALFIFVYMVYLAVTQTYKGEYVEIPYLTDFLKGQGWID
ncbi:MAG: hypothetical protein AB8G95_26360 [Anaerolineae bacterium]